MSDPDAILLDIPTTPDAIADRARRTVAAESADAHEARALLEMLGLIEPAPRETADVTDGRRVCLECRTPVQNRHGLLKPGVRRLVGRGLCSTCYARQRAKEVV
ncbi:hypothetical protein GS966_20165 [Rhodococcus hoagii]|nr:hypothetical protein [Prescottella equi]NKZ92243.1 hypothetical protein [Prescottella equi]